MVKQTLWHLVSKNIPYCKTIRDKYSSKAISRVLCCLKAVSIINLDRPLLTGSNNLPIPTLLFAQHTEASNFHFGTYLVFQLLRFTANTVTCTCRELLPHVFTLTRLGAVYFLWHWLSPAAGRLPVKKQDALCCPDFPPPGLSQAAIEHFAGTKIGICFLVDWLSCWMVYLFTG